MLNKQGSTFFEEVGEILNQEVSEGIEELIKYLRQEHPNSRKALEYGLRKLNKSVLEAVKSDVGDFQDFCEQKVFVERSSFSKRIKEHEAESGRKRTKSDHKKKEEEEENKLDEELESLMVELAQKREQARTAKIRAEALQSVHEQLEPTWKRCTELLHGLKHTSDINDNIQRLNRLLACTATAEKELPDKYSFALDPIHKQIAMDRKGMGSNMELDALAQRLAGAKESAW